MVTDKGMDGSLDQREAIIKALEKMMWLQAS